MFLNYEVFWMNNKTIIISSLCMIWKIMQIEESVIDAMAFSTLADKTSSLCIIRSSDLVKGESNNFYIFLNNYFNPIHPHP